MAGQKLGSKIVDVLLKSVPASELAVSVRNPEKAEALKAKGVDVRHGDFDKPETLDEAFKGVERLLIISADGDNDTRISLNITPSAFYRGPSRKRGAWDDEVYSSFVDLSEDEPLFGEDLDEGEIR